jgi:hypothetical protein
LRRPKLSAIKESSVPGGRRRHTDLKKIESSCHHAEGLKYMTALQGLLWKLKKSKTFLHRCSAFGSTSFVHCCVW